MHGSAICVTALAIVECTPIGPHSEPDKWNEITLTGKMPTPAQHSNEQAGLSPVPEGQRMQRER